MGERKVLNFYITPDFDVSLLPKNRRERGKLNEIRNMLPFSIQCNTCGEYMYRGKKFNCRVERLDRETYLGIKKFRFYIKCSVCSAEIIYKTDPQNSDYELESGASRNFEVWRETQEALKDEEIAKGPDEEVDAMKALESRTMDSKNEMDALDALDEIKAINKRHERVDTNALLDSLHESAAAVKCASGLTLDDEALIKSVQFGKRKLDDVDSKQTGLPFSTADSAPAHKTSLKVGTVIIKKKRAENSDGNNECGDVGTGALSSVSENKKCEEPVVPATGTVASSLFGDYSSSDEE